MNAARVYARSRGATHPGPCPVIETERLVLRPHRADDADAIAQSLNDWQVTRMLARVPMPYSRDDARDWLGGHTATLPDWHLAIDRGNGTHLGCVSLEWLHGDWHLGYWLNRAYWGNGLMSEAAGAAIAVFRARRPATTIHAAAFADNPASLHVQEKLGFRITGKSHVFAVARNRMIPQIETMLDPGTFTAPDRP
jgi:RimJ/RimL family protein N-acetyltransferase